jgi:hypothetical protein
VFIGVHLWLILLSRSLAKPGVRSDHPTEDIRKRLSLSLKAAEVIVQRFKIDFAGRAHYVQTCPP